MTEANPAILNAVLSIEENSNAHLVEEKQNNSVLSSTIDIAADLENVVNINAELNIDNVTIEATAVEGTSVHYDTYTGDYEVTSFLPTNLITTSIILPTDSKLMTDDVTIYSLPVHEEYNEQGGVTMTIGG